MGCIVLNFIINVCMFFVTNVRIQFTYLKYPIILLYWKLCICFCSVLCKYISDIVADVGALLPNSYAYVSFPVLIMKLEIILL
jgi:hypothetical protein